MVQRRDHYSLDWAAGWVILRENGGKIERLTITPQLAEGYALKVRTCAAAITLLGHRELLGPATAVGGRVIPAVPKDEPEPKKVAVKRLLIIYPVVGHLIVEAFQLLHRMEDA